MFVWPAKTVCDMRDDSTGKIYRHNVCIITDFFYSKPQQDEETTAAM